MATKSKKNSEKNSWSSLFNNVMATNVRVLSRENTQIFSLDTFVLLLLALFVTPLAVIFIILVLLGTWSFVVENK